MKLSPKFEEALVYATQAHCDQQRKATGIPYIAHILGVAAIALEYGASEVEAIGALLHDTVEDCGGAERMADIRARFGDDVAEIVDGCTDTDVMPKPPWRERKENYIAHLRDADASTRLVSASDKLHNARAILADFHRHGRAVFDRFTGKRDGTLWYYRALVTAFREHEEHADLVAELDRVVTELERLAAVQVPPLAFEREFSRFKQQIREHADGRAFTSFHEGLAAEWESYKEPLRNEALRRLDMPTWSEAQVGTGVILQRVMKAIEINESSRDLRNNLVAWQPKFGLKARSHHKLAEALDNQQTLGEFEQWFLDFASNKRSEEDLFEDFLRLAGKRYDLLAYLFFLKDWTRFMPIAPTYFDEVFRLLEVPLVTSHKCSWENYVEFNDALRSVQRHLIERAGIADARLIDAHSFCWMRVQLPDSPKS